MSLSDIAHPNISRSPNTTTLRISPSKSNPHPFPSTLLGGLGSASHKIIIAPVKQLNTLAVPQSLPLVINPNQFAAYKSPNLALL